MRGFLSQLRERIRKRLLKDRPYRYTAEALELQIAEEERKIADRVFDGQGDEEVPEVREGP